MNYAIGVYLKMIIFSFLALVILTWPINEHVRWDQHQHLLTIGPCNDVWYRFLEITEHWYSNYLCDMK
jgi:hypothetical protein